MLKLFYILFLLLAVPGCKKKTNDDGKQLNYVRHTAVYKHVPGTDENLLSLDVYYDPGKLDPKPVIIWVHGGGWCLGDKTNALENKKRLFSKSGYLLVSINYRLSPCPFEPNNPGRIKYPVHNTDVADAVKWVHEHIAAFGGDPGKLVLLGHSAGAHLVSLTGTRLDFLRQAGVPVEAVKGVASIDTKGYDVYYMTQVKHDTMYINAFGNDSLLNIQASPLYQINGSGNYHPAFFIAKRGDNERIRIADNFIDSLQYHGIPVTSIRADVYSHSEINAAIGKEGENIITPALSRFLSDILN